MKPWEAYADSAGVSDGPWKAYASPKVAAPDYSPLGSNTENFLAGAGKAGYDVARGAGQLLRQGLEFMTPDTAMSKATGKKTSKIADFLGLPTQQDIDETKKRDAALMDTKAGLAGNVAGTVATVLPTMLIPGAQTYTGASLIGAGTAALQPTASDESRLLNTAVGGAAGAAGKYAGDKVAGYVSQKLAGSQAKAAQQAAQNAPRDAVLAAGKAEGYVVPPSLIGNQGAASTVLEGLGGQARTRQAASVKNIEILGKAAREELGLAADDVLDDAVLKGIRQNAGQAYEAVAQVPKITATPGYGQAINDLEKKFSVFNSKFPQLANKDVAPMLEAMRQGDFTGREATEFVKQMRASGHANAGVANTVKNANAVRNLGRAQVEAAEVMDDLIANNLTASGQQQLFSDYMAARQLIAKTHTIENALDKAGSLNPKVIAKELADKPYGGKLKIAAQMAKEFPEAFKAGAKSPTLGATDAFASAVLGAAAGPGAAALPLARPVARSILLSDLYQAGVKAPTYQASGTLRLADLVAQNPAFRRILPATAAAGGVGYANQ